MLPMPCGRQIVDVFASHGSPLFGLLRPDCLRTDPHVNTRPVLLWVEDARVLQGAPRFCSGVSYSCVVCRCPPGVSVRWKKSGIVPVPTSTASKVVLSSGNLYFLMQWMRPDVTGNKC